MSLFRSLTRSPAITCSMQVIDAQRWGLPRKGTGWYLAWLIYCNKLLCSRVANKIILIGGAHC